MNSENSLVKKYPFFTQLSIEGEHPAKADEILCRAIARIQSAAADPAKICDFVKGIKYKFEDIPQRGLTSRGLIRLNPNGMTEWTVIHELAHAWDASLGWQLSERMRKATRSRFTIPWLHRRFPANARFWYHVGSPPAPCGIDKNFNAKEDFAESVTAYLFPDEARHKASKRNASYEFNGFIHFHDTPRGKFIRELFENGQ